MPVLAKKVVYRCPRGVCPKCFKVYPSNAPPLTKSLYENSLIAQAAVLHFYYGITIGKVLNVLGGEELVTFGGIMDSFHRLGVIAAKAKKYLIAQYRGSLVKHADEIKWSQYI